jgi:hypothetical protein
MATINKTLRLSEQAAEQLRLLAAQTGVSEDALLEGAIEILFALLSEDEQTLSESWQKLGSIALQDVWSNEVDQIYDNWKELYHVQEG